MADMTTYLKNALFNHVLRNTAYTSPTGVWITLFSVAPTDAGGGTEVSDITPRQSVTFGAPTDGLGDNSAEVLWDAAVSGYTVAAVGIHDAATVGNLLMWKAASETVGVGVRFRYPIGDFDVDFQ